ncbi:carboxy-S-adenosyl-L-methionine synthase CmoA [Aliarcobacter thereius]|uniref:Carboxy-S-adenosyl-L-methionine synthase n=2 Tax=Aliarcobacter thereius TaxID=544718 RepID=A0A1C0B5W3_9BACT|nr:carboxy-S-adenosyl-L-methionine synthase CmoA [Aliarcobacter thereius]OCL95797.1 tRNA (cmo5U34)-methyltransferase [Aliarcobacter thereius LMG 24486]OCL98384.1 tRNA (cmo5U34)-methyltransferase [Aliarcobacter thereius]QBF16229.1 carboxy-S-adenosyl-L-methionine synthase [Aliarcobacter thereius LMG 24486]TLS71008.1 carboxy-S-adenosyl-L-methionine synthase CmoA [Aliarcobacter thereius]TLS92147.1 carboxy-S-adenosyl-L-methionine synthase CmoA [Aliarcobacter thereius]
MTDKVFNKKIKKQFEFDEEVASVFDDMLERSIPYYKEMQRLSIALANNFLKDDAKIVDLGCSTASTLIELAKSSKEINNLNLFGVDSSEAMLDFASKKANAYGVEINFICDDIFNVDFSNSNVIFANYTLQFIRPLLREKLISKIFDSLEKGGVFIFCEKILAESNLLNKQLIDEYYNYKKNQGYSEFEISQKREALENVLIPYTQKENEKMIKEAGFSHCEMVFKWVNFALFIAIK